MRKGAMRYGRCIRHLRSEVIYGTRQDKDWFWRTRINRQSRTTDVGVAGYPDGVKVGLQK